MIITINESQKSKPKREESTSPLFATAMSSEKLSVTVATLQAFLTRLYRHSQRRHWTELSDRSSISVPESLAEAFSRVRKNAYYFRVNYLIVVAVVLATSLLTRPFTLLLLGCLTGAWLFLYVLRQPEQQLVIFGRAFTDCVALVGLSFTTVVVALLTNVVSVVVSAVMVGVAVVCCHGALRPYGFLRISSLSSKNGVRGLLGFFLMKGLQLRLEST